MPFNVVIFGEAGAGKSSLINLLCGSDVAAISSSANGCTLHATPYDYTDPTGASFRFWDTAGLNEGDGGRVPNVEAVVRLYSLIMSLRDGISLLIFVMRAPRIKDASAKNWTLFHEIICRRQVPAVIAITGLEGEENMDAWWTQNQDPFLTQGISPIGHACVAGTRGKRSRDGTHRFNDEYKVSREKMLLIIQRFFLRQPWQPHCVEWFQEIVTVFYEPGGWCRSPREIKEIKQVAGQGIEQLKTRCGMSDEEADQLGKRLMEG